MKKALPVFLALLLLASLVACGTPTSTTPLPTPTQTETATTRVVAFADPALEVIVRGAMGKPSGDITLAEAKTVTSLNLAYAEWQKYISDKEPISSIAGLENYTSLESLDLSGNAITDIAPLSALTNLKALILTGCAAEDYAPLASLTNLRVLMLDHSTISDPAPLLALSNLNCLYLEDSQIRNYIPLADIRANLELSDFDVAFTLAELGFNFNDGDKLALYQTDKYDIRINHAEWGAPPQQDWQNCIRVVTGAESGYKNAVGFYPEHNAYVVWMFNPNTEENYTYVYDLDEPNSFSDRASLEAIVREAFVDVNEEDVLLTPFRFFDNMIQEALGIPVENLYNMPFDDTIALQSPYEKLGFEFINYRGTYTYKEGCIELSIHKPQWDDNVDAGNKLDWSMSYFDTDVKGYNLLISYFEKEDVYYISLEKGGTEIVFSYYPATDKLDYDPQSIDPFRLALNEAFSTQGDDFLKMPMTIFKDNVQGRFGMSIEQLYALSVN
ncbi:MAG: leucine-rich repeat domain-containing protein [Bacteroidales bacterium]